MKISTITLTESKAHFLGLYYGSKREIHFLSVNFPGYDFISFILFFINRTHLKTQGIGM